MAIFRYPLQAPEARGSASTADGATEAIDYACFQRTSIKYDDKGFRGYSLPSSNSAKRRLDPDRVYLAMPKGLQTSYRPSYRQIDLGVVGVSAVQALNAGQDTESIAKIIEQGANAAMPEVISSALAQTASGLAQAGGLQGGLDSNSLQALTRGRVFNPFKENIFTGMNFREHTFNFKLLARSAQEAREIKNILDYFKQGSVPEITGEKASGGEGEEVSRLNDLVNAGAAGSRFFTVPDSFNIKFIRLKPDGSSSTNNEDFMHFKIHPSVCTGITVNYTPDGQYTSFKSVGGDSVQVPALNLTLSFTETKLITSGDITKGF
ncbi:baseplate tail tube cap [Cyanophage S-RIM12_RW_22_0110]|uniref:Baseplate tail tube cap n=1 Tax=Cyanophage S-RIM12 TaxID=1278402 RepID=A0A1D7STZ1_9CAUD|nr:baseplate tail tube cap [Cyanophage S-RIM12_RW_22_0110]